MTPKINISQRFLLAYRKRWSEDVQTLRSQGRRFVAFQRNIWRKRPQRFECLYEVFSIF